MNKKVVKPADVLPDGVDTTEMNGVRVRKGTIAAVLANAEIFESDDTTDEDKLKAISMIEELAPAVVAIGLCKHVEWKNKKIQYIFDMLTQENE